MEALETAAVEPAFVQVVGSAASSGSPDKVLAGLDRVLVSVREQHAAATAARDTSVHQYGHLIAKYETLVKVSEEELDREESKCDPDHPQPELTARKVHKWSQMLGKDDAEVELVRERLEMLQKRYDEDAAGMVTSTRAVATQREQVEHVMQVVEEVTGIVATHYGKVQTAADKARLLDAVSLLQVGSGAKRASRRLRRTDARLHRLLASVKDNAQVSAALTAAVEAAQAGEKKEDGAVRIRVGQDIGGAVFDALERLQAQLNAQLAHLDRAWDAVVRMNETVLEPQRKGLEDVRTEARELDARREHLRRSIADAQKEERRRHTAYAACEELVAPVKERLEARRASLASVREAATVTLDEQRRALVQLAEQEKLAGVLRKMIAVKLAAVRHALARAYTAEELGGATGMHERAGAGVFAPTDYLHDEKAMAEALMAAKTGMGCEGKDCEEVMAEQRERLEAQLKAEKDGAARLERELGAEVERAEEVATTDVYAAEFAAAEEAKDGKMTLHDLLKGPEEEDRLTASEALSKHLSEKTELEVDAASSPSHAYIAKLRAQEEKRAQEEERRIARQRKLAAERVAREKAAEAEWTQQQRYAREAERVAKEYGIPLPAMTGPVAATGAAARTEQARLYRETVLARVQRALARLEAKAAVDPGTGAAQRLVEDLERAALSQVSSEVGERLRGAAISREEATGILRDAMAAAARSNAGAPADVGSEAAARARARAAVEEVLRFDATEALRSADSARVVEAAANGAPAATGPLSLEPAPVHPGADLHPAGKHNSPSKAASDVARRGSTDAVDVADAVAGDFGSVHSGPAQDSVAAAVAAGATGLGEEGMAQAAEAEASARAQAEMDSALEGDSALSPDARAAFEAGTADMSPGTVRADAEQRRAAELAEQAEAHRAFLSEMQARTAAGAQAAADAAMATGATGATGMADAAAGVARSLDEVEAAAAAKDEALLAEAGELESKSSAQQAATDAQAARAALAVADKLAASSEAEAGSATAARLAHARHVEAGKRATETAQALAERDAAQREVESQHVAALAEAAKAASEDDASAEQAAEEEAADIVDAVLGASGATGTAALGSVSGGSV